MDESKWQQEMGGDLFTFQYALICDFDHVHRIFETYEEAEAGIERTRGELHAGSNATYRVMRRKITDWEPA